MNYKKLSRVTDSITRKVKDAFTPEAKYFRDGIPYYGKSDFLGVNPAEYLAALLKNKFPQSNPEIIDKRKVKCKDIGSYKGCSPSLYMRVFKQGYHFDNDDVICWIKNWNEFVLPSKHDLLYSAGLRGSLDEDDIQDSKHNKHLSKTARSMRRKKVKDSAKSEAIKKLATMWAKIYECVDDDKLVQQFLKLFNEVSPDIVWDDNALFFTDGKYEYAGDQDDFLDFLQVYGTWANVSYDVIEPEQRSEDDLDGEAWEARDTIMEAHEDCTVIEAPWGEWKPDEQLVFAGNAMDYPILSGYERMAFVPKDHFCYIHGVDPFDFVVFDTAEEAQKWVNKNFY